MADHPSVTRECKHCATKGVECPTCEGTGWGKSIEEPICDACDGDGVLEFVAQERLGPDIGW